VLPNLLGGGAEEGQPGAAGAAAPARKWMKITLFKINIYTINNTLSLFQ
jgi:hypothetical protein